MARSVVAEPRIPIGRHDDHSWLHAKLGQLAIADGGAKIICHACGEPLTRLSAGHLRRHNLTPHTYRSKYGLNRTTPLLAPELLQRWELEGRRRHDHLPALREGLDIGQAMAADGSLLAASHAAQRSRSLRLQGRLSRARIVAPVAAEHALRAAQARDQRAREAGFDSATALVKARRATGRTVSAIATELGTSTTWVTRVCRSAVESGPPGV